ncbi:transcriptional repressor LexA [Aerosakkonemataceae cyanobacterium BLCC-F154]|uniref:LexA repressor n=1 Tax=Floridaenema fluviatile BLCC-F154 TaxID=3153640 RepID=A0ABV4YIY0_9CYAN
METLTEAQQELYDWLVEYINQHHYAPSIRQMMRAMNLKSPAPVQSRLDHLREKGYITWTDGKARTYRILRSPTETEPTSSVPILGAIAAGGLVEPYTDSVEKLDLANTLPPKTFALRVIGDSMIDDHITDGDLVIMYPVAEPDKVKNGTIVAARVEGHGTTLKRFYRRSDRVILKPANVKYQPIEAPAEEVQLQGTLFGVWRNY